MYYFNFNCPDPDSAPSLLPLAFCPLVCYWLILLLQLPIGDDHIHGPGADGDSGDECGAVGAQDGEACGGAVGNHQEAFVGTWRYDEPVSVCPSGDIPQLPLGSLERLGRLAEPLGCLRRGSLCRCVFQLSNVGGSVVMRQLDNHLHGIAGF